MYEVRSTKWRGEGNKRVRSTKCEVKKEGNMRVRSARWGKGDE